MKVNMEYELNDEDPRVRTTTINGRTFTVEQKDPYGFCYITWDSTDALPNEFEGAYTSFNEAFHVVKVVADRLKKEEANPPSRKKLEVKLS